MKQITCEMCGSTDLIKHDGVYSCQTCGTKYSVEEAKKMMIEGSVEVTGTVKVDDSSKIDNYYSMAENAYAGGNLEEAEEYCNKVIEIVPNQYRAWLLKGKAAGWQSTLQNPKLNESATSFAKSITCAPESLREVVINECKEEIMNLARAMMSLRSERFFKWPDQDEGIGFVNDLVSCLSTIRLLNQQTNGILSIDVIQNELLAPLATLVTDAVMKTWDKIILPEFCQDENSLPTDSSFVTYYKRSETCVLLLTTALELCSSDIEEDIRRYKYLIILKESMIKNCGYDYKFYPFSSDASIARYTIKNLERQGFLPDYANKRVYYKSKCLNDNKITEYNGDIDQYKRKIVMLEKEVERRKKEEERKRKEAYWRNHSQQRVQLENEREYIAEQIEAIQHEITEVRGEADIRCLRDRIHVLTRERDALSLLKRKEKKDLKQEIENINDEISRIMDRMSKQKADIEKRMVPLHDRLAQIVHEFEIPR